MRWTDWRSAAPSSESRCHLGKPAMGAFTCDTDRLGWSTYRPDWHEAHVANTDEAQDFAQIGCRHVGPAAVDARDVVAAACQDHDCWPVLEQGHIALRGIEPERQSGLN